VVVRAQADVDDDQLEARLAALRKRTPGEGAKAKKRQASSSSSSSPSSSSSSSSEAPAGKKAYDYSDEVVHWEGSPAAADLGINFLLGFTLVCIPLTIAAIGRTAFIKYRFTDKRVSVQTNAPWKTGQTDCAYQEVAEVRTVARALGLYGDMVVVLKNGDKLELRSVEKYRELKDYILQRRDALGGGPKKNPSMMDLDLDDDVALNKKKKGFAQ